MSEPTAEQQSLIDALQAEYGAVFAFGLVAAFTIPARAPLVSAHTEAHRARRDATIDALTAAGVAVPEPAAGYSVPLAVRDGVTAAQLAVRVEVDTAVAWRSVIERSDTASVISDAVLALTESALRAAQWRTVLGAAPATTALPGQP